MKSPYLDEFNNIKVIMMVEVEPLSDHFHQIALTKDQYQKVIDFIADQMEPDGTKGFCVPTDHNSCVEGEAKPFYTLEEIKKLKEDNEWYRTLSTPSPATPS